MGRGLRISLACATVVVLSSWLACSGKKTEKHRSQGVVKTAKTAQAVPPAVPFAGPTEAARQTKLLRFPDIHGDLIVFTYAGDLWLVRSSGGTASRLTSHSGLELFAKFSPDGAWIAFTGQYGGDEQVYVIATAGGEPRQLTYYPARGPLPARWGYDNQVYGWSSDGSQVLFRSLRDSYGISEGRLYLAPVSGGLPTPLPMLHAGAGDLHPTEQKLLYSPLFRDFRTWKRYEGGWAQDLYLFDLQGKTAAQLTEHKRTDRDPMWVGDDVYFASDRDGVLNIYRHDSKTAQVSQVTSYRDWDVRWPSSDGKGQIVFELDGELQVLAIDSGKAGEARKVAIFVPDDGVRTRPERVDAAKNIEGFALGPVGKRALLVGRGDVFSVPAEHGPVRNLTHSSNAHDREAIWSPDGKEIAFISDWTGEQQIWLAHHDGSSPPRPLTTENKGHLYNLSWSPDGKRLAYRDQTGRLYAVAVSGGQITEVTRDPYGRIRPDYSWSPDGQYLAFSRRDPSGYSSIYIWRARDGDTKRVTGPYFDEYSPSWHPGGKHLYFLSEREFHPQIDGREWNFIANRATGIFALALSVDSPNPFPPRDDRAGEKDDKKDGKKDAAKVAKDKAGKPTLTAVKIDFEGIAERVTRVPVEADNYRSLVATDEYLVYVHTGPFYYGRESSSRPVLTVFSLKKRKAKPLVPDIAGWSISRDGKKVLVQAAKKPDFKIYDVQFQSAGAGGPAKRPNDKIKTLALAGMVVHRVAREEWAVVFNEVWRRFRDYFYVANMHGYDWNAVGEKYRPLLEHVGHRSDLNYVIGEMIAELNVSHAYIAGGDERLPERAHVALPGARFELDRTANRYRISKVLKGQNAEARYRSPLTEVGVNVAEGDYLLAINGRPLDGAQNPYALLQLPKGKPVELTVSPDAGGRNKRTVLVDPIASETSLFYLQWIEANRKRVDEATGGRVGYLHLPDMGANGIREFSKWYYGQIRKEGLVVDVRGNGGGNVSQMIIERLRRTLLGTAFARTAELTFTYPYTVFHGHMAVLMNETSGSDGDIFPWMFRQAGLGPLIGKRSWGGVVGISFRGPLVDGGQVYVPEFGTASEKGQWIIEGRGVEPDIEVANDPVAVIEGKDAQLDRAIAEIMKQLEKDPRKLPSRPAAPVKLQ